MNQIVFRHHFDTLYRPLGMFALRYTGCVDEAEDVVQEAFVKAWQALQSGVQINDFKAYMYRLVRNGCIDLIRSRRNWVDIDLAADVPQSEVDTSERDARIWSAVDALPAKCREVFVMHRCDGLSHDEISRQFGISVKTVKNQMTKAYARLRDALGENFLAMTVGLLAAYSVLR